MVFRGRELERAQILEHREPRVARWLRESRLRLAAAVGLGEAALLVFDVIDWLPALLVALAVIALYVWAVLKIRWRVVRELTTIAAMSQVLVVLVPVLFLLVGALALIGVIVVAVVAVAVLLARR